MVARLPISLSGVRDQRASISSTSFSARISALVDVNPHKQGGFAPGTGTAVVGPESLRGRPVRSIIVMNPLYRDEVAQAAHELGLAPDIIVA
ncbi:MAG: hypothetical protein EOS07_03345 [Mesorhizobium sp.]|nr:MAG: hypothetical protein EOS07_03345 [Mesorhizobium sp.]